MMKPVSDLTIFPVIALIWHVCDLRTSKSIIEVDECTSCQKYCGFSCEMSLKRHEDWTCQSLGALGLALRQTPVHRPTCSYNFQVF